MSLAVLMVHNQYRHPGGEANVMENERRMLQSHGDAVFTYCRNNSQLDRMPLVKKLLVPFSGIFSVKTYRDVRRLIRENGIQVVQVHNTVPLISPSVYYAAWSLGVPVVQTIHNYRFLCPNGLFYRDGHPCEDCVDGGLWQAVRHGCYRKSRMQSLLLVLSMGIHRLLGTYGKIEACICLTPFAKEKLSRLIEPERIYIKPNVLETAGAQPPLSRRKRQFCCVTRLDREKGVYVLLEAFRQLPGHRLLIAGQGDEARGMADYIRENRMEQVQMLGNIENAAARALIAESYAMILPTQMYEGFPMTLLESLSCGTPVIGSDVGSVLECLGRSGAGCVFTHDDPADLAEKVRALDDETWAVYHRHALAESRRMPDEEENYRLLTNIYRAAMARRQGGSGGDV